ncbi:trypsin-like peptidase domain-containing protein [Streptomyces sp. DSM 44917]|uniref:Trypsin-like peptidase domain-containing protein n=2 Tax=Streptomyces boetiae TaxID=3075541 RepID=A0ABU2L7Z9_9ACTN|nr:trypsin-like peptidase domain-containing protein [Streptomyces sp. DSM 44917]MDT0307696.1 trypsin-like peptidase domain-containing protein [Streptomyces sp. DSM 44917]
MDKGNGLPGREADREDPYSTPPYGQPGPWAPAPPVQRPTPTPPAGTHVPPPQPVPADLPPPPEGAEPVRYDPWATSGTTGAPPPPGPGAPPSPREGRPPFARLVAGAAAIALLAGVLGGVLGVYLEREGAFSEVRLPQAGGSEGPPADGSIAGIADAVLPGVVTLHVSGGGSSGTGTGFVLDDQGHILTNAHVVRPAGAAGVIEVTFSSGDTAQAEVVGQDSGYDLAVVRVSGVSGLSPLTLGNSDAVRVGDPVVAIGAPFDLAGTVTSGIISATERPITAGGEEADGSDVSYVNALQTDAPINPGNSGGPLVDIGGRVIGVNSAIRTADSGGLDAGQAGSVGLGFAIPVNQARDVAEQLINTGRATHPVIGVTLDTGYLGDGARIGSSNGQPAVVPGGPAERAGVREGDIITAVDGDRVRSGDELIVRIRSRRPGDELTLTVQRGGQELSLPVTLGESSGD